MPRPTDHVAKAAVIADVAAGFTYADVAARHGISTSTAHDWANPSPAKKRPPKRWGADELALTGGRWVNDRGVMRWVAS